jgi:hypothetical protein
MAWVRTLIHALLSAEPPPEETGSGDWLALSLLGLVVLFFVWLVVAVVRKKLTSAKGRLGDLTEDEAEAA